MFTRDTIKIACTILLFATLANHPLNGQGFTQYNPAALVGASVRYKINPTEEAIEGSPYYLDEWKPAVLYMRNNTYVKLSELKYNLHKNELIFRYQGQSYLVGEKTKIERLTIGDEEFKGAFDGRDYSFYKILLSGELMLLERSECRIKKGQPSKGYIAATPDKYQTRKGIYIIKPDNNAVEINPKKGMALLSYIPDKRDVMEAYLKVNKMKMRTLEDLTNAVKYYNTISGDAGALPTDPH